MTVIRICHGSVDPSDATDSLSPPAVGGTTGCTRDVVIDKGLSVDKSFSPGGRPSPPVRCTFDSDKSGCVDVWKGPPQVPLPPTLPANIHTDKTHKDRHIKTMGEDCYCKLTPMEYRIYIYTIIMKGHRSSCMLTTSIIITITVLVTMITLTIISVNTTCPITINHLQ